MILAEVPWTAIRDALKADGPTVAILPCGATEAHGPHLPLNTDVLISDGIAQRTVEILAAQGFRAVVLPALAYAPADYAAAFPGTISISTATARALMLDIADALKTQGFACIAIANSHFDPANVAMLRQAAADIAVRGLPVAFPDFTRRALAQRLGAEFVSGACHAGQFETSLVLADRAALVDEAARRTLAENPHSLVEAFAAGAKTFADAGGPEAYFGAPAAATVDEGQATFMIMAETLAESIRLCLAQNCTSV